MITIDRNKVIRNFIWRILERCGSQGISFVITIVLARLLDPSTFGTIALVTVISGLLEVFVISGFGSALIQKKDADDIDYSSVFYFNLLSSIFLYILVFVLAPHIANWYNNTGLTYVIRLLCVTLLFSGINNVQNSYVSKNLLFKVFFYTSLISGIVSGSLGIFFAFKGFGIWSLVIYQVSSTFVSTIILWYKVPWRPKFLFSIERLKFLFSFGWKLLFSGLLNAVYGNATQLIVGKMYTTSDLAFYNRGHALPNLIISNINSSLDSVLLPTLANEQNNISRVKSMTRRAVQVSSFVIWPMVMGLAASSNQIVELIFTAKWLPAVPYMMCFCFSFGFWPVHTANLNAIKAMGRSDLFLKLEIIKKTYGIIGMILGVMISPLAMALSSVVLAPVGGIVNAYPNRKLLGYTFREQVSDMVPTMLLACFMGAIVYTVQWLGFGLIVTLILQIITGVVIYVSGAYLLKFESFFYILNIIKNR